MHEAGYEQLKNARLHFMGIGGQGISAVAQMALSGGASVTGCDQAASAITHMLEQQGIPVQIGHSPEHLLHADALIYVPAVAALDPDNPELVAAKARGMQVMTWQEMLGRWMLGKCALSVSGVHGKGTTTAMLALMLVHAGLDPSCEIGAIVPEFGTNYRIGKSQYFVNEADEFNNNFWHYHPRLAVVTSIEFEHPEFFADYPAYLAAFEHFVRGMDMQGDWPFPPTLILNAGSPGCLDLRERLHDWPGRIASYFVEETSVEHKEPATFVAYDVKLAGETSFRVRLQEQSRQAFPVDRVIRLQIPGIHNIQNALAALAAAHTIGLDADVIVSTLENFGGIGRRFEIRHQGPLQVDGEVQDVVLIDDYAHHPTAIMATLEAARRRFPGRRLIAVYQPHMYSRTRTFFEQFLSAFDKADVIMIADIFPGRERDTGLVHSRELVEAMAHGLTNRQVMYSGDVEGTAKLLRSTLRSGDVAIIMGAGDVYIVARLLLHEL
ncbi:MAG TPA: UDP-N-acetylmuramate--L-alanine ligase [Ktedonobacteraceae bacterium]|nr:UDP-N-acetylmuramate--L-alanine ligase [Ktedonobacteraceae bacterium]